ncbi:hypothetical protein MNBD_GAMMA10-2460 [hydrothermal vent metagenome]|uniref:Beta-ketoacyl synthase N-terminal domain-containing protein n=1 Tax=hydrothermal vent metagenome TaxID=652676 RepID=A0A3B0XWV5_9ZZZZ
MSNKPGVYIAAIGMITAVGASTEATVAAVNAEISRLQSTDDYCTRDNMPCTVAYVPEEALPDVTHRLNREEDASLQMGTMLKTIEVAIKEVLQDYPEEAPITLFFSGPEAYHNGPYTLSPKFPEFIVKQTDVNIDLASSRLLSLGRAGVIDAIDLAIRYLEQQPVSYVLVGGADSYLDDDIMDFLQADDRVLAEGVMDGFAPGEGAGFLLLTNDINKAMKENKGVISLSPPGVAMEEGHMYSKEPYRGDGLAQAFRKALDGRDPGKKIGRIYSTMNGEKYWAKEYGVATLRAKEFFAEALVLEHPADCFGDTGGAAGALLVGLAAQTLLKQGKEDTCLVTCSSDQAYRAAICVNYEKVT